MVSLRYSKGQRKLVMDLAEWRTILSASFEGSHFSQGDVTSLL